MRAVELIAVCVFVLVTGTILAIVARQRWLLTSGGAIPLAVYGGKGRWSYGTGRYFGGELRWYRAIGVGRRPQRVFERTELLLQRHRRPAKDELSSLPDSAIVIECRHHGKRVLMALGEGAFTGFVSWLEASAPAA